MLAETLALAVVLASPGSPPARTALALQPENGARARRGLLPRKTTPTPPPSRRMVLRPQAPTWLGEPGEPLGPAPEVALEPAADVSPSAAAARVVPALAVDAPGLRASAEAVAVEVYVMRRAAAPRRAALEAAVAAPQLEVVLRRRLAGG